MQKISKAGSTAVRTQLRAKRTRHQVQTHGAQKKIARLSSVIAHKISSQQRARQKLLHSRNHTPKNVSAVFVNYIYIYMLSSERFKQKTRKRPANVTRARIDLRGATARSLAQQTVKALARPACAFATLAQQPHSSRSTHDTERRERKNKNGSVAAVGSAQTLPNRHARQRRRLRSKNARAPQRRCRDCR